MCKEEGCTSPSEARGWCNKHYLRWWKHGDPQVCHVPMEHKSKPNTPLEKRLANLVLKKGPEECWGWLGTTHKGYGRIDVSGVPVGAHRVSYALHHSIPLGEVEVIRHTCDNPPCTNPNHLVAGTQGQNCSDAVERGRARIGHRSGEKCYQAKLTWDNVTDIRKSSQTYLYLANKYGVSSTTISDVKKFRSWKEKGRVWVDRVV